MMRRLWIAAFSLLGLCLGGCTYTRTSPGPPVVRSYLDPEYATYDLRRIVVLPFGFAEGNDDAGPMVEMAFRDQLQRITGLETVAADPLILEELGFEGPRSSGRVSLELLVRLGNHYRADSVLFGDVTAWRPYEPAVVGVAVELMALETGRTVWDVDGLLDTAEGQVVQSIRDDMVRHGSGTEDEWSLAIRSPRHLSRYLAARCVRTLR